MIEKGTTMDYFRRTALIACICISVWCCIVNGQESQPHDWRYPQQVHEFGSFKIAFGDISAELGRGALVLMEARPGIIGVVIVAPGRLVYKSEESIEDSFETAMLRFHHEDFERMVEPKRLEAADDPTTLRKAMESVFRYFYRCYNSGRLALIPPKGTLAVVFDGKEYGEKIVVHYNSNESFISPSMPELMVRKELTNLPEKDTLTRQQQWRYDLLHISNLLPMRHPSLFFRLPEQEFKERINSISRTASDMSDVEIFLSLRRVFTQIGDAHTTISPPNELAGMYPLEFYWFKDGLFVTAAGRGYEQALKARLVQIGETGAETIYKAVSTIIPHENVWQVRKESPYPMRTPKMLEGLGLVTEANSHRLTFETAQGRRFVLDVEAVPLNRWREIQWTYALDRTDPALPVSLQRRKGWYWFEYIEPSKTLYFQYNRCKEMREKPIAALTKELLALIDSHDVGKFIFDIRYNGGGGSRVVEPLIKALTSCRVNRHGKLFCLIARKTFSSAILNAVDFRRETQAIFVGEPTSGKPGHFGQVENMVLPYSKIRVKHSTKYCGRPDIDSTTMTPDIRIEFSSEDFFAGRDPVLETVLAYQAANHKTILADK